MFLPDGTLCTTDLTLASYLDMFGIKLNYQLSASHRKKVVQWVLPGEDITPEIRKLITDYASGQARVEPKRFSSALGRVRNNMYIFIGHKPARPS